ncbi:methylated-DNA--[protein]-cysteine S-methyltransferase [Phenylobacterium sp.]|uniref:methylated-DNA--[protein]-cysteine S-methyltransferase n=1 Tax=Phenylobacterium sp. TaxID=1871053 RepID=UPI002733D324|nr:methylated-DNA--[protein]-cysteine S-methyltransferase [Phenylobacterium sp.]MDP3660135.1 methylated-DNA--[protein]-cysteine S-methyltransferase [Phenylobacterium sp.]
MTSKPLELSIDRMETPTGQLFLVTDRDGALRALDWTDHEDRMRRLLLRHYGQPVMTKGPAPASVRRALEGYFAGDAKALESIRWETAGTAFQRAVWRALCTIPAGETLSYSGLAAKVGSPKAVRAVGTANGSNPVALVVPCHRVIGADGSLTGYAGGLDRKRWLLAHEGAAFKERLAA